MRLIASLAAAALFAAPAFAQNARPGNSSDSDSRPGCRLPNPVTAESCWTCFRTLLNDCDTLGTADLRAACYTGANNFYTWCLGRVGTGNPRNDSLTPSNHALIKDITFDVRGENTYEISLPAGTTPDDIAVFFRYSDQGERREIRLADEDFFIFDQSDNHDVFVIVLNTHLGFNSGNVGIITAVEENGQVTYGYAFSPEIVDSFDVNGDGVFNSFDRVEAMQMYANDKLDHATLTRILNH